jgi:transcription antitermination factor NusG
VKVVENVAKTGRDSISGALPIALAVPQRNQPNGCEWYAIQTRYRCEKKVTDALERKGFETFIPLLRETHRWSDRKKAIDTPLFSGYTFARLEPSTSVRRMVVQTQGVIGFVASGSQIAPVPPRQVEDLRRLLSQQVPCALAPFLNVGRRVRVRGGCLDGLEGILAQNDAKHLVVSIESIQRSVAIQIDGYELELI